MPIYEYGCRKCKNDFEALVRSETIPECPNCHSTELEKMLSVFATTVSSSQSNPVNLANNFGIRHHNDQEKTAYDTSLWLSWMFYFYLATIHVVLRKHQQGET